MADPFDLDLMAEEVDRLRAENEHLHDLLTRAIPHIDPNDSDEDYRLLLDVADHLERHGQLDAIGGPTTLTALIAEVPLTGNAARYAAIIRRDAHHRRLLAACRDLTEAIYALDDEDITAATWRLLTEIAHEDTT